MKTKLNVCRASFGRRVRGFAIGCVLLAVSSVGGQELHEKRTWSNSTGRFSVDAKFDSFGDGVVHLVSDDNEKKSVPVAKLCEGDQQYLRSVLTLVRSREQMQRLQASLTPHSFQQKSIVEIVHATRKEIPHGIYARFYLGCLMPLHSREVADVRMAKRYNAEVIDAVVAIQKYWPELHRQTLTSAYNNQAVVAARDGSPNGLANFLELAATSYKPLINVAAFHNASLLLGSQLKLDGQRAKLATVVGAGSPPASGRMANQLMYNLKHDSFELNASVPAASDPTESKKSASVPPPTADLANLVLLGSGSGFLVAPNLAITNRHVAEDGKRFRVRNDDGYSSVAKTIAVSSDPNVDLALLELSDPCNESPLSVLGANPRQEDPVMVLGYPLPDVLELSLTSSRGSISKYVENDLQFIHSASTDPGNSGGPCVDNHGRVVGVHAAKSAVSSNVRNYAVSASALHRFLTDVGIKLPAAAPPPASGTFADVLERVRKSVFFIEIYGDRPTQMDSPANGPIDLAGTANADDTFLLADGCCLWCGGSGYVTCGNCVNGYRQDQRVVKVGVNGLTGAPVMAPKSFKVKCGNCNRAGKIGCPACRGSGNAQ